MNAKLISWLSGRFFVITVLFSAVYITTSIFPGKVDLVVAEEVAPEDVVISTPVYHPEFGKIDYPLGTYNYTVSWQGIPAADASISLKQNGLFYTVQASAKTYSGIDLFYKLRFSVTGIISTVDFLPTKTTIDHRENSRIKKTDINYLENGDISAVRSQEGKNTKSITFDPKNFTLEPISAGFIARGFDWEVGKSISLDTFNGKTRYLIELHCIDKKIIEVNDKQREVWVITPTVKKLTITDEKPKLKKAFIYLTADKEREVLQIDSEVFVGTVKTSLDSFTPDAHGKPGQTMAQENSANHESSDDPTGTRRYHLQF